MGYDEAVEAFSSNRFSGIGFVFTGDDTLTGIDLDDCLTEDGTPKPWAAALLADFPTYAEVSPSGNGIKLWCKAKLSGAGTKAKYEDGAVEIYDRGRYFTVTGRAIDHHALADCQDSVDRLYQKLRKQGPTQLAPTEDCIEPGKRHAYLLNIAGSMRSKGLDQTAISIALHAANKAKCRSPKPHKEIEDIATFVCERPARQECAETGSLITRRVSDIEAKRVNWLWQGQIARGKVTIIAGNPGLGKSQITASFAAIVTTGGSWPVDGSRCTPGDVVFLSAEDDPADTLRPRLEAAGADLRRVHVLESVISGYSGDGRAQDRSFSLQTDILALSKKLAEIGNVAVLVIDPITAYLGGTDSHKNAEVRALLAPLSELAARHDTAVIGVSHLNKSAGSEALMRVTGSLAFVAAARAAYLVAQDPENPARRFFLPMKNNIGPDSVGTAFRIESATVQSGAGPLQTSLVVWESVPVTTTANEVMRTQPTQHGSALRGAEEWLKETLIDPTPATEIHRMATDAGITPKTLRRASEGVGVMRKKSGMDGPWTWSLPPKVANNFEDAQQKCLGVFADLGHLRNSGDEMVEVEL